MVIKTKRKPCQKASSYNDGIYADILSDVESCKFQSLSIVEDVRHQDWSPECQSQKLFSRSRLYPIDDIALREIVPHAPAVTVATCERIVLAN